MSSPAFEGYAYVGNIIVKVTAGEGVLPEGTTVSAYQVDRQDVIQAVASVIESDGKTELKNSVAIDVTLIGPDGNVIQPDGAVNVCFFNTALGSGDISVYRVADDASSVQEIGARQADPQVQSFDVDHFSIYVVGEGGISAVATYTFVANGSVVSTQIVKTGDVLLKPEAPEIEGKYFLGWFNGESEFTDFNAELTIDDGSDITLNAQYADAYYAFFENEEGVVVATKKGAEGVEINTSDVTFPVDADESIVGWQIDGQGEIINGGFTFGAVDVTFRPVVNKGAWLTFDSQGGTYIAPRFYNGQESPQQPSNPERVGYEFDGWYANEACTERFDFNDALTESRTIYANWNPNINTQYTILYWTENADDAGYTYVSSRTASGTTGESVNLSSYDQSTNRLIEDRQHFTYNSEKTESELENVTIAGDGSTVVNVYFSRNTYTLTFRERSGWGYTTVATITAKYNAYIANRFNQEPFNTTYNGRAWEDATGNTYDYALQTLDRMPGNDVTFNLYRMSSYDRKTIYYYVENIGANVTSWPGGSQPTSDYTLLKTVNTYFNYATYDEEYHEIQGFTRFSENQSGFGGGDKNFSNNRLNLFYMRNSYNLEFVNGAETYARKTVDYEARIADAIEGVIPDSAPDGTPNNYEFVGWYTAPEGGERVTTDSALTMPAGSMRLYARWEAPEVSITIYDDVDGSNIITTEPSNWGTTISQDQLDKYQEMVEVPDGYVWHGWFTKDERGNLVPFSPSTQLQGDVALYPYYTSSTPYSVTYVLGEGASGEAPTDNKKYAEDSYAKILSGAGLTGPEATPYFMGWQAADGTVYAPGDYIRIEGNTTLTAAWGAEPASASIIYYANYPADTGDAGSAQHEVGDLANNAEHKILSLEECGFTHEPSGYYFAGWSKDINSDGSVDYEPGADVRIDNIGTNALYGVWIAKYDVTVTAKPTPTPRPTTARSSWSPASRTGTRSTRASRSPRARTPTTCPGSPPRPRAPTWPTPWRASRSPAPPWSRTPTATW